SSSVSNSSSSAVMNVIGGNVGGFVGYSHSSSSVSNSSSSAVMTVIGHTIGGLVGNSRSDSSVSNSSSFAVMNVTGDSVGGLVGENDNSLVLFSSAYLNFSGSNNNGKVGGLVGYNLNGGFISYSKSSGNVFGSNNVGGLVGLNENSLISNSYTNSNVTALSFVGGVVGYNLNSNVANTYSTGSISGDSNVGGIVGTLENSNILTSFTTSNVSGNSIFNSIAGLILGDSYIHLSYYLNSSSNPANLVPKLFEEISVNNISYFYNVSNNPMDNWDVYVWEYSTTELPVFVLGLNEKTISSSTVVYVDADGDGTLDFEDKLLGNILDINFNGFGEVVLKIDNSKFIDGVQNTSKELVFEDLQGNIFLSIFKDFSSNILNMDEVSISRVNTSLENSLFLKGFDLQTGENETIYFKVINSTNVGNIELCVVDKEINFSSDISSTCNGTNEFLFDNISNLSDGDYVNISQVNISWYNITSNILKITGLSNSAIIQFIPVATNNSTTSNNGGNNGGNGGGNGGGNTGGSIWSCILPEVLVSGVCVIPDDVVPVLVPVYKPNLIVNISDEIIIPKNLFDITFNINLNIISDISDLISIVTFENFGTSTTFVNFNIVIYDIMSNIVFSEEFNKNVEIEETFTFTYMDLDLSYGDYKIVLTTNYGDNVSDEFIQKFKYINEYENIVCNDTFNSNLLVFLTFISLLIFGAIYYQSNLRFKNEKKLFTSFMLLISAALIGTIKYSSCDCSFIACYWWIFFVGSGLYVYWNYFDKINNYFKIIPFTSSVKVYKTKKIETIEKVKKIHKYKYLGIVSDRIYDAYEKIWYRNKK
ncbi:MAG: hypothetical protein HRU03_02845, partial [Nanoarchaeales archaeon]|nr:hypothetical protein [Nanoarchaeales archaeon]